ncbi:MAG: HlyD family type I secretion periplasmic adaptor subunit [Hyphomicrobiales bacterium]
MSEKNSESTDRTSLKKHGVAGMIAIFAVFGSSVLWASYFDISGAVVTSGSVVVESHAKSIQHRDGGIVAKINVRDEDVVTRGQLLAVLDDTEISANHTVIQTQLNQAIVKEARLLSEIADVDQLDESKLRREVGDPTSFTELLATEKQVFTARRATRQKRTAQISEQIIQIERQIDGYELQRMAVERQLKILKDELQSLGALFESKLIEIRRITSLEKEIASKEGQIGQFISSKAEARASIAEKNLQIQQLRDDFLAGVLDELQTTREQITKGFQQKRASLDKMDRTELRAPDAGVVHQSKLHTVGGVIKPGDTLMLLVPQDDELAIDVKIKPIDIDKVFVGQNVVLRLSSFDQRETPELIGTLSQIAPDITLDQATRDHYYGVRITISRSEFARLPESTKLVPGMPVEAFIKTEDRSVLSYLVSPFAHQLNRAFRED